MAQTYENLLELAKSALGLFEDNAEFVPQLCEQKFCKSFMLDRDVYCILKGEKDPDCIGHWEAYVKLEESLLKVEFMFRNHSGRECYIGVTEENAEASFARFVQLLPRSFEDMSVFSIQYFKDCMEKQD